MGPARVLSPEQIAAMATRFAAVRWAWADVSVAEIGAQLGWTVLTTGPGGAILDTGLAPANGYGEVLAGVDGVAEVGLRVADPADGDGGEPTGRRRDAFAAAVRATTGALGTPVRRDPGVRPEARWALPNGVVRVSQGGVFVELALLSPAYAAELDEADGDDAGDDLDGGDW